VAGVADALRESREKPCQDLHEMSPCAKVM